MPKKNNSMDFDQENRCFFLDIQAVLTMEHEGQPAGFSEVSYTFWGSSPTHTEI